MKKQVLWSSRQKLIWGLCLLVAWCLIGLILYKSNGNLTVEQLVNYRPKNPVVAALTMLGLFLLKSVDFIMYSGVLYAASGILFPLPAAIALNIVGAAIMVTPVYFIGRSLGAPVLEALKRKYPKLNDFVSQPIGGELTLSLLLRSVGLSLHVGSLYLGAAQVRFGRYLLGSVLGLLPMIITDTVMGTSVHDPKSPAFMIALAAKLGISALSLLIALILRKRGRQKTAQAAEARREAGLQTAEKTEKKYIIQFT